MLLPLFPPSKFKLLLNNLVGFVSYNEPSIMFLIQQFQGWMNVIDGSNFLVFYLLYRIIGTGHLFSLVDT